MRNEGSQMLGRGKLTDTAWSSIEPVLPASGRRGGQLRDHRTVVNGILWKLRTGAPGASALRGSHLLYTPVARSSLLVNGDLRLTKYRRSVPYRSIQFTNTEIMWFSAATQFRTVPFRSFALPPLLLPVRSGMFPLSSSLGG
jgi:hypothetical protein